MDACTLRIMLSAAMELCRLGGGTTRTAPPASPSSSLLKSLSFSSCAHGILKTVFRPKEMTRLESEHLLPIKLRNQVLGLAS